MPQAEVQLFSFNVAFAHEQSNTGSMVFFNSQGILQETSQFLQHIKFCSSCLRLSLYFL